MLLNRFSRTSTTLSFGAANQSLPTDGDPASADDLTVEFLCIISGGDSESFFITIELKIIRYTPRVPAGARSAKGHNALGDHLAVSSFDHHLRIE